MKEGDGYVIDGWDGIYIEGYGLGEGVGNFLEGWGL